MIYMPLLAVFLAACSCSVKEDRLPCPAFLTFDVSAFREVSDTAFTNLMTSTQNIRDTLELEKGHASMEWSAEKGEMTVYAFSNLREGVEDDGIVMIPPGKEADPLRAFCHSFECYEEQRVVEAVPNRQTALVHLEISDSDDGYPYTLQVESDVCGIDLRSLKPLEGRFFHDLVLDRDLSCRFNLPRQRTESKPQLNLLLDGVRIDALPLHSWLEAAGYDWTADDLPDIRLNVDPAKLRVTVNVQGWEHEEYEIVL